MFVGFRSPPERRMLLGITLGAYVLKTILVTIYFDILVKAGLNGFAGVDPANYHRWATEMAREIRGSGRHFSHGWKITDPGYTYICSHLYAVFGNNTFVPRFLNCAISSAGAIYVYRIANHFFGEATARLATLLHLFLPFSLLITLDQRKDPIITFLALGLLWHAVHYFRIPGGKATSVTTGLLLLLLMHYMRSAFLWPFFGILITHFALTSRNILVTVGGIAFAIMILVGAQLLLPEDDPASLEYSVNRFEGKLHESEQIAKRESGLLRFARVTSIVDIWKAPFAAVLILITPFPPFIEPARIPSTIASWANLFVVGLLPALLWGIYLATRRGGWRPHALLLLYPLVYIFLIGVAHPDVTRYRETAFPAVLILMSYGVRSGTPAVITMPIYAGLALLGLLVTFSRYG